MKFRAFIFSFIAASISFSSTSLFSANPVDANSLIKEFQENELNAKHTYVQRRFSVSGRISRIFEDSSTHSPTVQMDCQGGRLVFAFEAAAIPSLSPLKTGSSVTIEALCVDAGTRASLSSSGISGIRTISFRDSFIIPETSQNENASNPFATQIDAIENKPVNPLEHIVIIEGKKGRGTGFIVNYNKRKAVITNAHVLFENNDVKFTDFNGRELPLSLLCFAPDRDIAVAYLPEDSSAPALDIASNMASFSQGTGVTVYGNSMGDGVSTTINGTLLAIGPKTIEVTAVFVSGNSGSPVIDKASGRVIGVATSAVLHKREWSNANSGFTNKVRRFATRIDNLEADTLQPYDFSFYKRDLKLYQDMQNACIAATGIMSLKGSGQFMDIFRSSGRRYSSTSSELVAGYFNLNAFPDKTQLKTIAENWNKKMWMLQSSKSSGKDGSIDAKVDTSSDSFRSELKKMRDIILKTHESYKTLKPHYVFIEEKCNEYDEILLDSIKDIDQMLEEMRKDIQTRINYRK